MFSIYLLQAKINLFLLFLHMDIFKCLTQKAHVHAHKWFCFIKGRIPYWYLHADDGFYLMNSSVVVFFVVVLFFALPQWKKIYEPIYMAY